MNIRSVILVAAALLVAGGTAYIARGLLNADRSAPVAQAPEKPTKRVLIARADMPAGSFIKDEDVAWHKWPQDGLNSEFLIEGQTELATVVGAVVRKGMVAGEPILLKKIVRPGDRGFLAAVLTPGMRAVTIGVNDRSGVAGLVFPGDRVDIILNMQFKVQGGVGPDEANGGDEAAEDDPYSSHEVSGGSRFRKKPESAETILENVRILAANRRMDDVKTQGEAGKVQTVTIEVSPKQAEMVRLAAAMGTLSLSLRGLAKPEDPSDPVVASAEDSMAAANGQSERAILVAAETATPPAGQPQGGTPALEEPPTRGASVTFDIEVSRAMEQIMNPPNGSEIVIVRGGPTAKPKIQVLAPE
jgi:pilus assembly protein CpaB